MSKNLASLLHFQRRQRAFWLLVTVVAGLCGFSRGQVATLSTTSLNFGDQAIGTTSASKSVRLTNSGTATLVVSGIVSPTAPFTDPRMGTSPCPATGSFSLAPKASCTVSVTFAPTTAGTFASSILFTDNAPGSPQIVNLSGTGVVQASLSTATLSFGNVGVGVAAIKSATLYNNLNTSLSFSASASGDFAVTGNGCFGTVPALGHCPITISFTPIQLGTRTGTLAITDNASNSPQTAALTGNGTVSSVSFITVAPANSTISVGATQQYNATGTFPGSINLNLTTQVTWSSLSTKVANVSNTAGSQGLATGKAAGTSTIKAALNFNETTKSASTSLTVTANGLITPTINWLAPAPITYGTALSSTQLDATASAGGVSVPGTFAYTPPVGTVLAAGTQTLSVLFTPTDTTHYTTATANVSLTVNKAAAIVSLSNLIQTYTGSTLSPAATTVPAALSILWTGAPDTNAGTYPVTATVNDPNYTGSASGSFVISPAAATVKLSGLIQTYTGNALTPSAATIPSGLAISWTGAPDINVGTYPVTATINNPNYTGSASGSFVINAGTATVTLSNLSQTYTGNALTPTVTTNPPGLAITWTGAPDTNAGTYQVAATINNPDYTGSASGSLVIGQAAATVTANAASKVFGSADPALTASETGFTTTDAVTIVLSATRATGENVGTYAITPSAAGSATANYTITFQSANFTVTQATPAFGSLTASQSITVGTPSINLAGVIAAGSVYPPSGEMVAVTVNGSQAFATIGANGSFSVAFPTAAFAASSTAYIISYSYAGDTNFAAATNTSTSLTVNTAAVTLSSIAITPANSSVSEGSTLQLTATGTNSDGSTQNLTATATWSSSPTSIATVSGGLVTAASSECAGPVTITATYGSVTGSTTLTVTISGGFACLGNMTTPRDPHTATLLNDGRVLITGGFSTGGNATNTAEIYSPSTDSSTSTGSMNVARANHTATLLDNGKVLIVGGVDDLGNTLATAELFDPAANGGVGAFTLLTNTLATGRSEHTATMLADGAVLILGGINGGALSSAEIFIPATSTFNLSGNTATARYDHTATLLNDGSGNVLVAGGVDGGTGNPSKTYELFNPACLCSGGTQPMNDAHTKHTATLLDNGSVLIVGGIDAYTQTSVVLSTIAELYMPATGAMSVAGTPLTTRFAHTATLLNNGTVLIAGGDIILANGALSSISAAELYDPNNTSTPFAATSSPSSQTTTLNTPRGEQTATLLQSGNVLFTGGIDSTGAPTASIELYTPISLIPTGLSGAITVTPNNIQIPIPTAVQFTATATINGVVQTLNSVTWSSSDTTVLRISNDSSNSGNAFPLKASATPITVSACFGSAGPCGQATVTVTPPAIVSVSLTPLNPPLPVPPGNPITFTATATYSDGTTNSSWPDAFGNVPAWSSSDPTVATIDQNIGVASVASPLNPNSTTITVSLPGANGTVISASTNLYVTTATITGSLSIGRMDATATLLNCPACSNYPNGRVLIAGGGNSASYALGQSELYDPTTKLFSDTTGLMTYPREFQTATLLLDGRVLIVGGLNSPTNTVPIAELYDPTTDSFTATGSLITPRYYHTATLIQCSCPNNGKVLIVGGQDSNLNILSSAELFDPATGTFTSVGSLATARFAFTATLLDANGRVLVAGGVSPAGATDTAEIFDPSSLTFNVTGGNLSFGRSYHTATLLNNGQVLIAGGFSTANSSTSDGEPPFEELFDPTLNGNTGGFTPTAGLTYRRRGHTATLLNNGKVLIAGGDPDDSSINAGSILGLNELYNPGAGTFGPTGSLNIPRMNHMAVLLLDGTVLIVGGQTQLPGVPGLTLVTTGEIYTPVP